MPGVGHEHDPLAVVQRLDAAPGCARCSLPSKYETTRPPIVDAEVGGEAAQPSGVLGRDHVGAGQLGGEPW